MKTQINSRTMASVQFHHHHHHHDHDKCWPTFSSIAVLWMLAVGILMLSLSCQISSQILVINNDTNNQASLSHIHHKNVDHHHHHHHHHNHWRHYSHLTSNNNHKRRDTSSSSAKNDHHNSTVDNGAHLKSYTTSNKSINFTHIEFDSTTGTIYVGASNWIFQLDSDTLRVEHAVRTGPIRDSPICPPSDCSSVNSNLLQITNNVNKILLVEPYARMLIVCGSVHQGACTRHRLEDISQHEDLVPLPVASNDENCSTIAFVGPARYFGVQLTPILYVAATDSRSGPYRDMVPAISGRSLESSRLFTIIDRGFADSARVDISSNLRDYFLVHYVYGFYANDYVYFAQVQRRSYLRTLEEMGYATSLSRVCVSDAGFHTYTELTLQCYSSRIKKQSSTNGHHYHHNHPQYHRNHPTEESTIDEFNLLQDAILIKAGADLCDSMNIERGSLVLIGVFANSHDHTNRANGGKSAICIYPIIDIEQRFAENIHLCYNGSVYSRNMDYIAGSVNQCPEPGAGNVFNFCNEAVKLNGSIPLRTQASIVYDDGHTILTAIAAGVTGQHTVAFVGTNYGSIKKVLLTRANHGHQFDEIEIDHNQPILADMFVDNDQNPRYVIAASPYKVTKFAVETCLQHNTCDQCLEARNPYCGWCSLQKRCTIKSECLSHSTATAAAAADSKHHSAHHYTMLESKSSLFSTPRWLSLETSQCIDFQAIKPEFMSRNIVAPVELIINQLPPLPYGANYLCVFEQQGEPIPATVTRNGLICQTPSIQLRPKIPNGHDHVSVDVAVRSSETDTDFIHRRFIYFDCSVHRSCKSCVMSAWDCNWCMHQNLCTNNASSSCTRRMKNENNVHSNSLIKSVQHCPSFDIQQEILIPDGRSHQLSVEIKNLMPIFANGFECIVEIEQAKERVEARISDNKIICNELLLSYEEQIGQQQAQLTVLWNSDTLIDRTNFTIYKCQYLGAYAGRVDCSLCQTRDDKFNCVWCQNQCIFNDDCNDLSIINTCPPPRIDYIHPISGPVEGGTLVSIEGSNLGSSFDEIKDRISIGGIPCQPIEYNISIRVVCRTGPSLIGPQSALVVIGNRAGVSRAQEKFQYKIITLIDVNPKIGPQSGGTRIYLSGKNLNIGSNVAIYLDDLPCIVERSLASSFQMSCRTSAAPYSSYVVTSLTLMIDGANYSLSNPFLYTSDPIIDRIEPLQSFFSGGRMITVIGSQFTSIQQPRMLVFVPRSTNNNNIQQQQQQQTTKTQKQPVWSSFNDVHMMMNVQSINEQSNDQYRLINESLCTVISSIKMICQSPMINGDLESLANNLSNANQQHHHHHHNHQQQHHRHNSTLHHIPNQIYLQIGFIMDDTISALHLDIYYPNLDSRMLYVSDPSIYSINNGHGKSIMIDRDNSVEQGILPFDGDVIIIEGENLAVLLLSENELNVTIGQQRCNITSVNMRQIVCQPPKYPPASTDELGRRTTIELPAIVLKIGNMRRNLGYLHYLNYFYDSFNSQTSDERDDTSRFYHQNHPPYNSYGNRFESISNTINVELLIVVCILIGTILTIISIIILAAYKHKTNEAEREYKRIQLQMDTLENNVRSECKQAFAELQTDILHANGLLGSQDLSKISLPTHDERTFLLRMFLATGTTLPSMSLSNSASTLTSSSKENQTIDQQSNFVINNLKAYHNLYDVLWNWSPFFKNDDDSTSPNDFDYQYNDDERKSVTIVLEQFHQLLLNRTFLLTLINTLEQHTKTVQERMRFASLLMITLLDRMEYSFDIMRHLLAKLIDRYALGKHMHHNQSIKRNETIAEKMLIDWLAICLFKYAREISSMPFFLMYSAIKHQIDKGPVDYVTGNSRYSLSEDKLLREQIDYKTLTVNVLLDHKLQQALPLSIVRFSGNTKHRNRILMPTTLSTNRLKKSSDHHSNVNNNSDELQSQDSNVNNNYGRTSGDQTTSSTDVTTATVTDNKEYDCEYYPIRILDCDTITQVKMKIIDSLFRYVANHERPSISDLQLSWRCYKPKQSATSQQPSNSSSSSSSSTSSSIHNPNSTLRMTTTTNNNNNNCDYNGTEASFNSDQSPSRMMNMMMINNNNNNTNNNINKQQSSTLVYQDVYGVASLMSKNDADKIYNASRRSDLSMEMSDIILDDYDHSTQIMTANEAIWRRLNTISHYGIGEGAVLVLSIKSSNKLSPTYQPTSVYEKQCLMNGDEQQQPVTIGNDYPTLYNSNVNDDSSEFHLYEQIPADRNSFYGCNANQDVVVVENVYNLSQASSSLKPSMNMHFAASAQQSYQQIYGIGNMPNPYRQLRLSSPYRPSTITSNHHRSFARNVYDRLSLFMRSNTSPKRSKHHHHHHHHHNHSFQINQRTFQNSNIFNSNNNNHINELHNVWHLVKPSSLIADCAFDPDSIKSSYNLRTMHQRRAFKRRQRQRTFMKTNRKCTSSSCQVNLDQMANMFNNSVSMNSLAINSPMPVATAATTAPNDSMLNTSASSLLSSLFCSDSQQQRQHQQQQQQQQQQQSNISTYLMHRSIPEIYLTRLLTTKGTIQQYVDDFFQTIFTVDQHLPIAIKWLFDFLDNSITDTNTLIRWKNDSLILPFWVSMIRMPEILFDIQTNSSIDVCLEVLAKNLIDSCQWNKENSNNGGVTNIGGVGGNNNNNCHTQTAKDCPSSKLLCARDVARYQQMISQYYKDISLLPPINEGDIFAYMNDVSKTFEGKVQKDKAIYELLTYCLNYKEQIYQSLIINETNNNAQHPQQQQQQLDRRFETIIYAAMATINMNESSSSKNNGQHQQQQHQQQHQPTAVAEQQQQHQRSRV